jgi:hypothetical protein
MVKRRGPPSQGWRTFLRNHAQDIAAMDLFVVPTIGFDLLYRRSDDWCRLDLPITRSAPLSGRGLAGTKLSQGRFQKASK